MGRLRCLTVVRSRRLRGSLGTTGSATSRTALFGCRPSRPAADRWTRSAPGT